MSFSAGAEESAAGALGGHVSSWVLHIVEEEGFGGKGVVNTGRIVRFVVAGVVRFVSVVE
jgi:hypothetical protein